MRKLFATEYVTLDGLMEEPGKWAFPFWSDESAKYKYNELFASDGLLLGRITYQGFAAAWPTMKDTADFGERMNSFPKYVVTSTLKSLEWNNSHLIQGNILEEVARLKQQPGQDIMLAGSGQLLDFLIRHDLIDELRMMVHPIILGKGKRLFREGLETRAWELTDTERFPTGIVTLHYRLKPRS